VRRSLATRRALLLALGVLLGCRAAAPSPTAVLPAATATIPSRATPATTLGLPANKLGVHLLLDDGTDQWPQAAWPAHLDYARQVAGEWGYVTELVRSDDLDVARWQRFMDLAAERHLTPIIRLATKGEPEHRFWLAPEADSDGSYATAAHAYAAFVAGLRWPRAPHYVVVGNEPNHGDEWGGRADPAAYARFLVDVSAALHAADSQVAVLNAALDPYSPNTNGLPFANGMTYVDAESFLDEMVAAQPGVLDAVDVWASHPYPLGPLTEGPWVQAFQIDLVDGAQNPHHLEPPPGVFNRGVNGYAWELYKLASYGRVDIPVMITETGWRHAESTDLCNRQRSPAADRPGRRPIPGPGLQRQCRALPSVAGGRLDALEPRRARAGRNAFRPRRRAAPLGPHQLAATGRGRQRQRRLSGV
jgi:hypothetical protein